MLSVCRYFGNGRETAVLEQRTYSPFITESDQVLWHSDVEICDAGELIRGMHNDFTTQLEKDLAAASERRRGRSL
jgi:hypothetical protein